MQTVYRNKTQREANLQKRIDAIKLDESDYFAMFWQLWGACSQNPRAWETFEHIVSAYLTHHHGNKEG